MSMENLKINDKFKTLIPPLLDEEFSILEQSCLSDGIRDAIVVWRGTIIDGHNRYEIAQRHGLEFSTVEMQFDSEEDVIDWMINNQLGKRNITEQQKSYLRGKRYENEKKKHGGDREATAQNEPLKDTSEQLAKEFNVGHATIKRDAQFSKGVDLLPETEKRKVLQNGSDLTKAEVQKIGSAKKEAKSEVESKAFFMSEQQKQEEIERLAEQKAAEKLEAIRAEKKRKSEEKLRKIKEANKLRDSIESVIEPIAYCEDVKDFLSRFDTASVDLLLTDPPYSTDVDDIEGFVDYWLEDALSKVKDTGRAYICIGAYPKEMAAYINKILSMDDWILDNPLIWEYKNTLGVTPKNKYNLNYQVVLHLYKSTSTELDTSITNEMFSVHSINAPDGRLGDRYHAWQKPEELGRRLLNHATKEGDIIIDPFCCTGTFLVAASKLGRAAFGSDNNSNNLIIANERGCKVQQLEDGFIANPILS